MAYNPPTRVVSLELPYLALVTRADPDWARMKFREIEYEFSNGKVYLANPNTAGAYNDNPNVYPVGTQEPR